jgi:hypothetical protein
MSSFEDIETQNGRRFPVHGRSKVAGFYAGQRGAARAVVDDPALIGAEVLAEIRGGDFREWMTMDRVERVTELYRRYRSALDAHAATVEPRPSRSPRTALPLLGPWAPPSIRMTVTLDGPDARTYDPRSLRITMADGTVLAGDSLCVEIAP